VRSDDWMKGGGLKVPCAFCGDKSISSAAVRAEQCDHSPIPDTAVQLDRTRSYHEDIVTVCAACQSFVQVHNDTMWPVRCPTCKPLTDPERAAVKLERAALIEGARG